MPARYPEIEPSDQGMLDVGDGDLMYWETCGSPDGKPAVVLHGGPGSGCTAGMRRSGSTQLATGSCSLTSAGCGRSRPHASDPAVSLAANTTAHLIADIERLRRHLEIERWLVFGGSWGCVLGLAYAERHPEQVTEMVLTGLATGRQAEVELLSPGARAAVPRRLGPVPRWRPRARSRWQAGRSLCPAAGRSRSGGARRRRAELVRLGGDGRADIPAAGSPVWTG